MDEFIERDAAIDRLEKLMQLQAPTARAIIEAIPAADVQPIRHGRWEQKEVFEAKGNVNELQSALCPVCQRYHTTPYLYYFNHYNYCPNCGAKMDGGET